MTNEPPPYPGEPNPSSGDLPSYGSTPPPPQGGYPPPPPGGYPPAPGGYGAAPYSAPDAIGYGWRKFKDNAGVMIAATLIVFVGGLVLGILSEVIAPSPSYFAPGGDFDFDAGATVASLVAQAVTGTFVYILVAMLTRGALDVVDGGNFDIGRAFGALDIVKVLITGLLLSVLSTIGFALCVLPGLIFSIFAYFTIYFVVDKDQDPVQSIGSSFSLVGRNFGDALLTGLLAVLVLLAGTLLCLVGLLAAIPIITLAGAYAFRRFQGEPVAP
ncbi:hypothetical protein [Aeromicrobium sp.]|uniref:hypothetical protein n=1 Tax=Aeromicrobium sp. TaxID=1871063 RepID=UPI002FCB3A5E